jgi:DNA helicase HerA-like ATPase
VTEEERLALSRVQLNLAVSYDDVWSPLGQEHVSGLHENVARDVLARFDVAERGRENPIGLVLEGDRGVGKTHMLRWVRQEVRSRGGFFFLVKFLEGDELWHSVLHSVVQSFFRGQDDQLTPVLRSLCELTGMNGERRQRLCGTIPVSRADLDVFVDGLFEADRQVGIDCEDTARALVLYRSRGAAFDAGQAYFSLDGELDTDQRVEWGFRRSGRLPQEILRDLSRLVALAGPAVLAIDQLDSLMVQSRPTGNGADGVPLGLVNQVADGLMEIRELTRRTLTVVACIPDTWELIRTRAIASAADRFSVVQMRGTLPGAEIATQLVGAHLASRYGEIGFTPPYPTWPVLPSAFETAGHHTPRRLLTRVGDHVRMCVESGQVVELTSFDEEAVAPVRPRPAADGELAALDETFEELRAASDVTAPVSPGEEDDMMPRILAAGLKAYIFELGERGQGIELDPPPGAKPALHARLRLTLDERTEDQVHWSFRAIAATHPNAVLSRIRSARTEAGLAGVEKRKLWVLRNIQMSAGKVTTRTIAEFEEAGGVRSTISDADIRTFGALEVMLDKHDPALLPWLVSRGPAGNTELFRKVFEGGPDTWRSPTAAGDASPAPVADAPAEGAEPAEPTSVEDAPTEPMVPTGRTTAMDKQVAVPLRTLRQHSVVFAGSGSGKTVLLRRLIEECALHGVSSIVLDPNNDLARLGDPWPAAPAGWNPGDAARAGEYLDATDVVVWTPRKQSGRPLVLRPLPVFADVLDDREEFEQVVEAAVAGLVPRVRLTASKLDIGTAVLKQALAYYALDGSSDLTGFVEMLLDLPDGVSDFRGAAKLAADMAERLKAATIVDPLFGGEGAPLDPGTLLTPAPGKRARVSVISFIGLPTDAQRQTFVNQLQLALFSWIKKNPAGDRPLGGLLVMDEAQDFAPSGAATACTESTLKLSAQARKYGLGLMFATQAPRGLHNRIPGNAATQFFGRLNSGVQINAAAELARRKGGDVEDIARLTSGLFYAASDGVRFGKVRMPMCLSHHPSSALTEEEVLARAQARAG